MAEHALRRSGRMVRHAHHDGRAPPAPFVLVGTLVFLASVAAGTDGVRHRRPRVTGLGCYALLPLTISLSQEQLVAMPSMVAGAIITSLTSSHAG